MMWLRSRLCLPWEALLAWWPSVFEGEERTRSDGLRQSPNGRRIVRFWRPQSANAPATLPHVGRLTLWPTRRFRVEAEEHRCPQMGTVHGSALCGPAAHPQPSQVAECGKTRSGGEGAAHRVRLAFDDLQEGARGALRAAPALLPILHGIYPETEARRELPLRHAELPADRPDVDLLGDMDAGGRSAPARTAIAGCEHQPEFSRACCTWSLAPLR